MNIFFPLETLKALAAAGCKSEGLSDHNAMFRGHTLESREIVDADYPVIRKVLGSAAMMEVPDNRRILRKLDALSELKQGDAGKKSKTLRILELVPEACRDIIGRTPHRWVFMPDRSSESLLPWFVEDVEFHSAQRTSYGYQPARTTISLVAVSRGKKVERGITLHQGDLCGSLADILAKQDAVLETPQLVADYEADLAYYREHYCKTGEQYLASGRGHAHDGPFRHGHFPFDRDGQPTKVVMDDGSSESDEGRVPATTETDFWSKTKGKDRDGVDEVFPIPVHPVVCVFSLHAHEFVDAHISSLKPYQYDDQIIDKLVLPTEHKRLIGTLTTSSANRMEDIVRGKASGVIVLCSGLPGTGKTLTAEVYSEAVRRPLYSVQCAQLGTDEEKLEKELSQVLERAARWKAILLIDEADVYIHERGEDIHQNAIVGVFLRLLEYFRGIMFMTTNRPTVVDDAILSRVTAHVRYAPPAHAGASQRLWRVLADQYGVKHLDVVAADKAFPKVSGRSVRQLLRLCVLTHDPDKISIETLRWASEFYDFPELEARKERP